MAQSIEECCSICFEGQDFRILQCGHGFCLGCIETIFYNNDQRVVCPLDRRSFEDPPHSLPTPNQFQGQLFLETVPTGMRTDLSQLIEAQITLRKKTIEQLRLVASGLAKHELNCAGTKAGGSTFAIIGGILGVIGVSLSLSGIGALAGVPLAASGFGMAAAGGGLVGGVMVAEGVLSKKGIDKVQEDLNKDYFGAEQLKILLIRSATEPRLARRWNIGGFNLAYVGSMVPRLAKLGLTGAAGARMALGIGRAATTTGLHVAGLALAVVLIPLDLAQLVISSIKIHQKKPSKVVQEISEAADGLEEQLKCFLIAEGQFREVYTIDGFWAYIEVLVTKKVAFMERLQAGVRLAELAEFGTVVQQGDGPYVPDSVKDMIQKDWFAHYEKYLLAESDDERDFIVVSKP